MIPYLLYFIIVLFLYFLGRKRLIFRVLLYAVVILFVGFRKDVGTDYSSYEEYYGLTYSYLEPGFSYLVDVLNQHSLGVEYMFFSAALITYLLIFAALELLIKEDKRFFPAILLMCLLTVTITCNGIRQCIAIAFFFFSYRYIRDRKLIKFLLFCGLGALFHFSLLLVLPLYFFYHKSLQKPWCIIIYIISFIFVFVPFQELIGPFKSLLEGYERWNHLTDTGKYDSSYMSFGVLLSILNYLVLFYFSLRNKVNIKYPVLFNLFFTACVLMNVRVGSPLIIRFQMIFTWFTFLILPLVVKIEKDKMVKVFLICFYTLSFTASTIKYVFFDTISQMVPYKNVLFTI